MQLNKLLFFCLLLPTPLLAAYSGINFSIGDESIPITSNNENLTLTPFNLQLSVEDKTSNGLGIGATLGKNGVKVNGTSVNIDTATDTLGLYLYFPYQINDFIGITSRLSIAKSIATTNDETKGEVEYLSKHFSFGLSLKWQNLRVTPTINAISINGNFKNPNDTNSLDFTEDQSIYTSLNIDYFSEHNSYIRFSMTEHTDSTFRISFITNY